MGDMSTLEFENGLSPGLTHGSALYCKSPEYRIWQQVQCTTSATNTEHNTDFEFNTAGMCVWSLMKTQNHTCSMPQDNMPKAYQWHMCAVHVACRAWFFVNCILLLSTFHWNLDESSFLVRSWQWMAPNCDSSHASNFQFVSDFKLSQRLEDQ